MNNQYTEIKNILDSSDTFKSSDVYDKLLKLVEKAEEDSFYDRISLMLDNCDRIRSNVELVQSISRTNALSDDTNGIIYSKKIKIFLLGDFSSGKTTFIKRILRKVVGASSQFPQTSTMIRHFGSSSKMQIITPVKEYTPNTGNKEEFSKVMKKFELVKYFTQKGDKWIKDEESISLNDWADARIIDFLGAIAKYPGFISVIDWGHRLNDKTLKYNLLDYADLYDVPGIGGDEKHNQIIDNAIENSPDIILYLINPDNGVPGENEEKHLIDVALKNSSALFFWCYQKALKSQNDNFVEEQKVEITHFIAEMCNKARTNGNISSNSTMLDKVAKYFEAPKVIDAAGDVNESFNAIEKVASIISNFFMEKTQHYVSNKKNGIKDIPERPEILPKEHSMHDPQQILAKKLRVISEAPEVRVAHLRKQLNTLFCDELINEFNVTPEIKEFIEFMDKRIRTSKDLILSESVLSPEGNLKKLADMIKGIVTTVSNDQSLCSFDFLRLRFQDLYKGSIELQIDLPLLQAYILFVLFYSDKLERIILKDIESKILEQIEKDLSLLKKVLI